MLSLGEFGSFRVLDTLEEFGMLEAPSPFYGLLFGIVFVALGALTLFVSGSQNTYVGVRTPWTLKSERSWVRTNRLAGRMFIVAGIPIAAGGFLGFAVNVAVFLGLLLSVSVLTTVYSYVQWRKDPDRKSRSDVPFVRLGLSGREAAEKKERRRPL